jgi:hypothetical protein
MTDSTSEWRFDLDDVGEEAEPTPAERAPIQPESVSPENALFVVVGALATVAVFAVAVV